VVPAHRKLERSKLYAPSVTFPARTCSFAWLVQLRLCRLLVLFTLHDDGNQRQWINQRPWTGFFVDVYCQTTMQRTDMHAMTPLEVEN
jgi:hypothetical protein